VLAVEAAEGTDAMLARGKASPKDKRVDTEARQTD